MQHTTPQDSTGALERCSDTAQATTTKADQRIHTKQLALAERVQEHEQVEDVLEESGLEDLMPKHVGQVHPKGCVDAHR